MPTPYYAFVVSDYVIGKPISFEEWRSAIQNPLAIAEGASGAPRIVVPTALSTAETSTAMRLRPNGSGGCEWVTDAGSLVILTGSGTWTPPVTGTVLVEMSGGGAGGTAPSAPGVGGAAGNRVRTLLAVTAGVGVAYAVGAGGTGEPAGGGGLGAAGNSTLGSVTALAGSSDGGDPQGNAVTGGRNGSITLGAAANAPGAGGNPGNASTAGGNGAAGYIHIQYVA